MLVDERVLTADFQPAEILHRHDEISTLSRTLQPISDQQDQIDSSAGAFVWGPTGTGKSCTTAYLIKELSETADVGSATVDCWEQHSSAAVYHTLLNEINPGQTPKRGTVSGTALWDRLCDQLDEEDQFIVVLDEADQLRDQQVLYQLYEHALITPILIANRKHDFYAGLDERVSSRLRGYSSVHFQTYTDAELVSILETRAQAALQPNAVSESDLEMIAVSAQGDARLAIGILRNAVRQATDIAELRNQQIAAAVSDAKTELRSETLEKISGVQQILFNELTKNGEQSLAELYERYCGHVDEPLTKRSVRNHLAKLSDYDLIMRHGQKRGRTYKSVLEDQMADQVVGE